MVIGIALALISLVIINFYIEQERQNIKNKAKEVIEQIRTNQAAVLVAKSDIPKGAVIESNLLEATIVPNQYVQPQAVTSIDRIAGMVAIASISQGEQITLSKLSRQNTASASSLAMATPIGKRAITISVDNLSALVGMIKPGDYVDVISMLPVPTQTPDGKTVTEVVTVPLFQNVLILAVGQDTTAPVAAETSRYSKEERKEIPSLITLALTPQEVNFIAFVQEQGKLRLVLRSPADSQIQPVQPASWETIFRYVMPQMPQAQQQGAAGQALEQKKKPTSYVEVYRGMSKESIPLEER